MHLSIGILYLSVNYKWRQLEKKIYLDNEKINFHKNRYLS